MEALILAAQLYAQQTPLCPKRFVNLWALHRERAVQVMPRKTCIIQLDNGRLRCNVKTGCVK